MFDSSVDIRRALPRKTEAGGVGSIGLNLFVSAGGNRPTAPVVRATSLADAYQSRSAGAFCRFFISVAQTKPKLKNQQTLNPKDNEYYHP